MGSKCSSDEKSAHKHLFKRQLKSDKLQNSFLDVNTPYASPNYQHLSTTRPFFSSLLFYLFLSFSYSVNKISVILLQNSAITKVMQQLGVNKTPHSFFSIASHAFSLCASNLASIRKSFQTTTFHYPLLLTTHTLARAPG